MAMRRSCECRRGTKTASGGKHLDPCFGGGSKICATDKAAIAECDQDEGGVRNEMLRYSIRCHFEECRRKAHSAHNAEQGMAPRLQGAQIPDEEHCNRSCSEKR